MEQKSSPLLNLRYPSKTEPKADNKFPSTRYFQIHFEYMEEQLNENRRCMAAMQSQITELTERVAQLTNELNSKNN